MIPAHVDRSSDQAAKRPRNRVAHRAVMIFIETI